MANSYTTYLSLRKPEVGAADDTWGGAAGLNGDLDLIDAVFVATGSGTSVGLHVGVGKTLNVEGLLNTVASHLAIKDDADTTKILRFSASAIATGQTRTLTAPDENGTIATRSWASTAISAARLVPPGVPLPYYGTTAPAGFVLAAGKSIGKTGSAATERANDDTAALYTLLWSSTTLPVSGGGRGTGPGADFSAGKVLTLPDHRGRGTVGLDNIGGAQANILDNSVPRNTMAGVLGEQFHTLTVAETPTHNHAATAHTHNFAHDPLNVSGGTSAGLLPAAGGTTPLYTEHATASATSVIADAGGGGEHNNMPPGIVVNVIISL